MAIRLAISAYRCVIGGVPAHSLDIQVRYFADPMVAIEVFLREARPHTRIRSAGETTTWPFVAVLGIDEINDPDEGAQVVGFIAGGHKILKSAHGAHDSAPHFCNNAARLKRRLS
jgi:hypothetical protein